MSTGGETTTEIRQLHVEFPGEQIDDLRGRIEATRWPSGELVDVSPQAIEAAASDNSTHGGSS
jgi:hypothetical protein